MAALEELTQELTARKQLPAVPMRRALRLAAGASLERTAQAVGGVTHEAVRTWELGKREPRGPNAISYAAVLRRFAELASDRPYEDGAGSKGVNPKAGAAPI